MDLVTWRSSGKHQLGYVDWMCCSALGAYLDRMLSCSGIRLPLILRRAEPRKNIWTITYPMIEPNKGAKGYMFIVVPRSSTSNRSSMTLPPIAKCALRPEPPRNRNGSFWPWVLLKSYAVLKLRQKRFNIRKIGVRPLSQDLRRKQGWIFPKRGQPQLFLPRVDFLVHLKVLQLP